MLYIIILVLFCALVLQARHYLKRAKKNFQREQTELINQKEHLTSADTGVKKRFEDLESKLKDVFGAYGLVRDISPLLDKSRLFEVFKEKLREFGETESISFHHQPHVGRISYEIKDLSTIK